MDTESTGSVAQTKNEPLVIDEPVLTTSSGLSYPLLGLIVLVPVLAIVYYLKVDRGFVGRMMGRKEKGNAYSRVTQ
jgi:hypothetical protein